MHHRVRGAVLGTIAALIVPRVAVAEDASMPAADTTSPAPAPAPAPAAGAPAKVAIPDAPTAAPAAPPVDQGFTWEPFGYLRMQYRIVQNDPNVAFVGRDDGFELQNARVGVHGAYADKLRFVIAIDGAVDERARLNVPEGKLRVGMRDAFVDVRLGGDLAIRAGFFEALVGPDLDGDTTRELVDRPLESRGVRATEGYQTPGLPPGRSLGASLRMDPEPTTDVPKIGFEVALQNGADEYASNNDNDTPAASASLLARFPRNTWLVASARFNRRTEGELPFRQDEDDLQGSVGARITAGPVGFGVGAVVQRTFFPTTSGPTQDAFGAHGQLMIRIPGELPIAAGYRFGVLDASSLILTDRVMEHAAGAVLGVPAYRMRVQLQLTHVIEQGARTLSNDRVQLAAEVAL